jgi:hypothetical protein
LVNVSAPIKIFALVGVLAALVLGGGMMLMSPGAADAEPSSVVIPKKANAVAAKANAAVARPNAAAAEPKAAAAEPKAAAKPKPAKPQPAIAANGLPRQVAAALRRHDVVVVALWGAGGKIDVLSRDEAAAGARAAGAGFVGVNVITSGRAAEALTLEVGTVLRTPSVLVFTRPDTLANKLDGFRDRDVVAQAALNALR